MAKFLVAGDIGGTNSRLLLYRIDPGESRTPTVGERAPGSLIKRESYENHNFKNFNDVLATFLTSPSGRVIPAAACLGVAGRVKNNVVVFTNRDDWTIDGEAIKNEFGILSVRLINDFVAAGYGLLSLNESIECLTLQDAPKLLNAPIICIGAGTGLGECYLTPTSIDDPASPYICFPSEGGHTDFAPRDELEVGLQAYLKEKFNEKARISNERVVSGIGLANIYEYLSTERFPKKWIPSVHDEIEQAGDNKGGVIAKNASKCSLCSTAMDILIATYGAEAGSAALKWLPFGGLYLTGGLTPKNIDRIRDPDGLFLSAFFDKGRLSGVLREVPVYAVLVEDLGERGAHRVAYQDYLSSQTDTVVTGPTESDAEKARERVTGESTGVNRLTPRPFALPLAIVVAIVGSLAYFRRR